MTWRRRRLDGVRMTDREIAAQRGIEIDPAVSPRDRAKIRRTIRDSFTQDEERKIAGRDRLVISTGSVDPDYSGAYYRRSGRKPALAVIEDPVSEDTVVHEVTHHMRAIDRTRTGAARAYPSEPRDPKRYRDVYNVEEAATVAETAARTRHKAARPSGYYDDVPAVRDGRKSKARAYSEDRRTMTARGRPQVGKAAVRSVNKNFDKTNISDKKLGTVSAKNSYKNISKTAKKRK